MKRFFSILTLLFVALSASAQMEHSIVLDRSSFRAVQTDALTGVNIDPIREDSSREPCARLKIKFDRMNKAQIDALEVKMRSNTDLTKQKVADYYDNVLILEMTAKPNTRFYFVSPEFGESNEVTLNLEGNREYEMLASLNQTYSIVVNSNVANADVYINGVFKGKTDASNSLTIKDVLIGGHTLKVVYGSVSNQKNIDVNSGSISFRVNVDTAANEPQFVVFTVEPQSAVVTIDGKHYTLTDGAMRTVLNSGTYNYTVSAVGYHSKSDSFTVAGEKVTKNITLTTDAATVTLTVADNAEIWVNGEKKGSGRWSGMLNSGPYIFEAKKAGYKTSTISKQISSAQPNQSFTLPAPTPIVGSIMVDGTPINADVALDGKPVGQVPLKLNNILIGKHTITISKSGYQPYTAIITVAEGKTATVNATLTKQVAQTPSATPTSSGKVYKVGDYYNENGKQGVVFEVSADGKSGKIVSMKQSTKGLKWYYGEYQNYGNLIGADNDVNGLYNMEKVMAISGWQDKYPAFKWCADLGEGWYLPSIEELKKILFCENFNKINDTIKSQGGDILLSSEYYWSSTQAEEVMVDNTKYTGAREAYVSTENEGVYFADTERLVRAVTTFGSNATSYIMQSKKVLTSAPYKVGDYYNDGIKRGVVFEVSADGKHGKIISLIGSGSFNQWADEKSDQRRLIGTNNKTDGSYNMSKVQSIKDWQTKYPVFWRCASLGEGWYLPAIEELKKFTIDLAICNAINNTLRAMGYLEMPNNGLYWSSTESGQKYKGTYSVLSVAKKFNEIHNLEKDYFGGTVRAVAKF